MTAASLAAQASGTGSLTLTATVVSKNNCKFNSSALSITFDPVLPSGSTAVTKSGSIIFKCNGSSTTVSWSAAAGNGNHYSGSTRRLQHQTTLTEYMAYSLDLPQSGSASKGTNVTLTITATIDPTAFQTAIAGTYTDAVTISVSP